MFVDASAIVAILSQEPEHHELSERLDKADGPITSGLAMFEAVTAIVRKKRLDVSVAVTVVSEFLVRNDVDIVPLNGDAAVGALEAFDRYGKGRGHPAQLNLCDCFAYAMAKRHGVALLYKGEDFSQTDRA